MSLLERRIGLLFAAFLALLAIGATKAAWLGLVKAGGLKRAAATQQEADIVVPARRGSITDDHGIELAVSQPAMDVAATTYPVKDPRPAAAPHKAPAARRGQARTAARQPRGRAPAGARPPRRELRLPRALRARR